ncbi:hypothetical protein HAZT_HAZT009660 [Hyalella azteca]|uniref:Spermatogenesis-associated protein 6 N-terminal domain-containing protein n=1 Tax=Hyalella azteca TaxID=294128 RepID=A0A6A0HGE0_HYAAZ|nr:hypothetical protein HAZT_HAZT009660 [Hyalella azteca]
MNEVKPGLCHQTFLGVRALGALETALERETAYLELVQEGEDEAVLAVFECSVRELLFPATKRRLSYSGMDLDLLMEPTRDFPGIISPKVEVSTRSTVSETRSPMHDCETDNAVYKAVTAADDAELPADAQIDQQRGGNSESRAARRLPAASDSPATPKSARTAGLTSRHRSRSEGNLTDIQYGQLASRYGGSRPNSGTRTNARLARLDDAHDATITVLDDDACQHCAGAHSVLSCTTCRAYRRLYPDSARSPHPRRVLRQPPQPGTARARVRRRYLADDLEPRRLRPPRPSSAPPSDHRPPSTNERPEQLRQEEEERAEDGSAEDEGYGAEEGLDRQQQRRTRAASPSSGAAGVLDRTTMGSGRPRYTGLYRHYHDYDRDYDDDVDECCCFCCDIAASRGPPRRHWRSDLRYRLARLRSPYPDYSWTANLPYTYSRYWY